MKKQRMLNDLLGNFNLLKRLSLFNFSKRNASTIVMPISLFNNSIISEHKPLLQDYRAKRSEYNKLLNEELKAGISKYSRHEYVQSLIHFDRVIALAAGDLISEMSTDERNVIARAYSYKAKILSHGSSEEIKVALAHIDIALELDPTQKVALECRNSIQCELQLSYDSDHYDAELGVLNKKT